MDVNDYQTQARQFLIAPDLQIPGTQQTMPFVYPALGLANEAGEVLGKIKKIIRDKDGILNSVDRESLCQELGDTLWYLAVLASTLEITLEDVAVGNLHKLNGRKVRGTIQGEGDTR